MQKIIFHLKPRSDARADGTSLVYIILRIDGQVKEIPTNKYVPLKNWDSKNRTLKAGKGLTKLEVLDKMKVLETILERCRQIKKDAFEKNEVLDTELFARKLSQVAKPFELRQFIDDYISENPDNWSTKTVRSYNGTLGILDEHFQAVYPDDIPSFRKQLEKKLCQVGNGVNTRRKRHRQFKTMLKRARQAGHILADPYQEPIGTIRGNRNFLTVEELHRTIRLYQDGVFTGGNKQCLRLFLFSCFTGCRYSDLEGLTQKNLAGDVLSYIAVKTARFNKRVQAPLPEVARSLTDDQGPLFKKVYKTGTINRYLKDIFATAGIRKHITFHCARHTFATLYIYLGGDVTNLQQIMAHSNIDTTMEYVQMAKRIDVTQEKLFDKEFAKAMRVITKGKSQWEAA